MWFNDDITATVCRHCKRPIRGNEIVYPFLDRWQWECHYCHIIRPPGYSAGVLLENVTIWKLLVRNVWKILRNPLLYIKAQFSQRSGRAVCPPVSATSERSGPWREPNFLV